MKKNIIQFVTLVLMASKGQALSFSNGQFPEKDIYIPKVDIRFPQYLTQSLYGTRKVVLTFDDGPDLKNLPMILEILKKYNVKATFFMNTHKIDETTAELVKQEALDGHILASHNFDHKSADKIEANQFSEKLTSSILTIKKFQLPNTNEIYFRFPFGAYGEAKSYHPMNVMKQVSKDLFNENCINFAFWDIDTEDWVETITPAQIIQNVKSNLMGGKAFEHVAKKDAKGKIYYDLKKYTVTKPLEGGVILMHEVHQRSVNALEGVLQMLKENNYQVVALNTVKEFDYGNRICELIKN